MDLITLAVPFFLILIVVELIADRVRGTRYYSFSDSFVSLSTGLLSQLLKIVQLLIPLNIYILVQSNFAIFEWPDTTTTWVLAFILYDLSYYWLHRCGHEIWILWAAHVVHHSSEEYNLTTALRQTSSSVLSFAFYLPMALLGFDPVMVATVGALNLIYQYWVHTQHIGKLGWAEWVFITPSNHRGHHAQNDVYIDRNYGGVFILWDRLFGSYQEELDNDPPIFGIRGALRSWNPVTANLQVYKLLWQDCLATKNWWYKLTIWFRRTGWRPPDAALKFPQEKGDLHDFVKYQVPISGASKAYGAVQYGLNTFVSFYLLFSYSNLSLLAQLSLILMATAGAYSLGMILENSRLANRVEIAKYAALLLIAVFIVQSTNFSLFLAGFAALSIVIRLFWPIKNITPSQLSESHR